MVNQVAYQVIGNDLTVTFAAEAGQLQLNAMEPVMLFNVLQSVRMLTRAITVLTERCVAGIVADADRCDALVSQSLALATALVPSIGYENAARVAGLAGATGRTIGETVLELGLMNLEDFDELKRAAWAFPTNRESDAISQFLVPWENESQAAAAVEVGRYSAFVSATT